MKYDQRFDLVEQARSQRIGARYMPLQAAVRGRLALQQERNVIRVQTVRGQRHQRRERALTH